MQPSLRIRNKKVFSVGFEHRISQWQFSPNAAAAMPRRHHAALILHCAFYLVQSPALYFMAAR